MTRKMGINPEIFMLWVDNGLEDLSAMLEYIPLLCKEFWIEIGLCRTETVFQTVVGLTESSRGEARRSKMNFGTLPQRICPMEQHMLPREFVQRRGLKVRGRQFDLQEMNSEEKRGPAALRGGLMGMHWMILKSNGLGLKLECYAKARWATADHKRKVIVSLGGRGYVLGAGW